MDYIVKNINEAVNLASEWRAEGKFSWFRGQSKPWPLLSSLCRAYKISEEKAQKEIEFQYGLFISWLEGIPALKHLIDKEYVHHFFAVLQHYGIPTHYIDFTTEPDIAGFFASSDKDIVAGTQGCIICIDPDDMIEGLRHVAKFQNFPMKSWPEKVIVNVNDHWRMQAQSGHFLYLPQEGVEKIYAYDRILFTHEQVPYHIQEEQIYPSRKSNLEIQLDEFFTKKLMVNNQAFILEQFIKYRESSKLNFHILSFNSYDESAILKPKVNQHESWLKADNRWNLEELHSEDFHTVSARVPEICFALSLKEPQENIDSIVQNTIQKMFLDWPDCRTKLVKWSVNPNVEGLSNNWQLRLERVWDGMRRLPFSNNQITIALANTLKMSTQSDASSSLIKIELASLQEVTSRAVVEAQNILGALRTDLPDILLEPQIANNLNEILIGLNPKFLFDFEKLVDLFAKEIIPSQALFQRDDLAIFFSPTKISRIGRP